jgi:uncharacterized tellurite resistance protein B-like protein
VIYCDIKVFRAAKLLVNHLKAKAPEHMFRQIETFITDLLGENSPKTLDEQEVRVACAALLVHCAKADGYQSEDEEQKLREILTKRFKLSSADTDTLIEEAQKREEDAVDIHTFTRILHANLDRDGRHQIVRFLWEITHADGNIDHNERSIVTLVASLLHVEVQDAVALRQDVTDNKS